MGGAIGLYTLDRATVMEESKRPIDWYDIAIDALTEDEAKSLLRLIYNNNISLQALLHRTQVNRSRATSIAPPSSEAAAELAELVGEGRAIG